ncbi:hypothetical protein AMATHDRAFT_4408 [Amanita thiersii Skay4041]|uniref:Chromatin associated protein KTI12 n=1 Tax=Amanita thiersii Skay4041 TaxID=703135 RepID=A0A2A9NIW3_9AGAR|nr:hypothetical protein AMATHDRAFT_4408 [Amanita thiersii Skay4041]
MALITIAGLPCSGKSARARQLKAYLDSKISDALYQGSMREAVILSDESLKIPRSVYDDPQSEKQARANLFSAIQRNLSCNSGIVLIVDSMNYIKGFRYQLYCAAKEAKLPSCSLYVAAPQDFCRKWNEEGNRYLPDTFENLLMRFEEPSSMVRWDFPLFTVISPDENIPGSLIWESINQRTLKPPNTGTIPVVKAPTNALHALENITSELIGGILSFQSTSGNLGGKTALTVCQSLSVPITLPPRNITLGELQRIKRQFVTLHRKVIMLGTTQSGSLSWDEESISHEFVGFLEEYINRKS